MISEAVITSQGMQGETRAGTACLSSLRALAAFCRSSLVSKPTWHHRQAWQQLRICSIVTLANQQARDCISRRTDACGLRCDCHKRSRPVVPADPASNRFGPGLSLYQACADRYNPLGVLPEGSPEDPTRGCRSDSCPQPSDCRFATPGGPARSGWNSPLHKKNKNVVNRS